jgi:precorrin-6B methylase 2
LKEVVARHCSLVSHDVVVTDLFDEPSMWRIEAAQQLGLSDRELVAVMSPGPGFPAALRSLESALPASPRVILDLGAGCGGVSEWLRASTEAVVYAVEPAAGARRVAHLAFPLLRVVEGTAERVPLPGGVADAVTISGVLSLMSDIDAVIDEVDRLLTTSGRVAITDLFSSDAVTFCSSPNVFRSVEDLTRTLRRHRFSAASIACGEPTPEPAWAAAADAVDEWITANCADRPGYDEWSQDRRHLRRHIDRGDVIGGCVVAERT